MPLGKNARRGKKDKCEECSMRYLFGRQGEPWCTYFDVPLDGIGDNCRLTPAAMHLVEILIANGISDEDANLVEKAIAGEGRLVILHRNEQIVSKSMVNTWKKIADTFAEHQRAAKPRR